MEITLEKDQYGNVRPVDCMSLFAHCAGGQELNGEMCPVTVPEDKYNSVVKPLLQAHGVTTFNETWTIGF